MHVSHLVLLPMTLVLAAPLDTSPVQPVDSSAVFNTFTSTSSNDAVGSVQDLTTGTLGTTFVGTPDQLGTTNDILSANVQQAPAGVPGTGGTRPGVTVPAIAGSVAPGGALTTSEKSLQGAIFQPLALGGTSPALDKSLPGSPSPVPSPPGGPVGTPPAPISGSIGGPSRPGPASGGPPAGLDRVPPPASSPNSNRPAPPANLPATSAGLPVPPAGTPSPRPLPNGDKPTTPGPILPPGPPQNGDKPSPGSPPPARPPPAINATLPGLSPQNDKGSPGGVFKPITDFFKGVKEFFSPKKDEKP